MASIIITENTPGDNSLERFSEVLLQSSASWLVIVILTSCWVTTRYVPLKKFIFAMKADLLKRDSQRVPTHDIARAC